MSTTNRKCKTPGLFYRGDTIHIYKSVKGIKITGSTGTGDEAEAVKSLAQRIEEARRIAYHGERPVKTFDDAAAKYIDEYDGKKRSIDRDKSELKNLFPFIGHLPLDQIYDETLQPFIKHRLALGRKINTVNQGLVLVRRILLLAARKWRDNGKTWLDTPPLIELLDPNDARKGYPLSWKEQKHLLQALPDYLAKMALFKVNTGAREHEVSQLRWDWEVQVPELDTSVFLVPAAVVKNSEERVLVLNSIASSIVEGQRELVDEDEEYVFPLDGKPIYQMNNTTWRRGRIDAALSLARADKQTDYIHIEAEGRYENLRWVVTGKRKRKPEVQLVYTFDDHDDYREAVGQSRLKGAKRKDYGIKAVMRYRALKLFFIEHWPEVADLATLRVHDLKHTFGRRLRACGVNDKTLKVLLGHTTGDITDLYTAAEIGELLDAAERVCHMRNETVTLQLLRRRKSVPSEIKTTTKSLQ